MAKRAKSKTRVVSNTSRDSQLTYSPRIHKTVAERTNELIKQGGTYERARARAQKEISASRRAEASTKGTENRAGVVREVGSRRSYNKNRQTTMKVVAPKRK